MKKTMLVTLMFIVVVALAFTACNNGNANVEADDPPPAADVAANDGQDDTANDDGQDDTTGEQPVIETPASGELSGTVVHWVWGDFEEVGAYRFNQYYPDIHIEYVIVPSGEILTRFQTALAAGAELPDIINIEIDHRAAMYSLEGVFYNLEASPFYLDRGVLVEWAVPLLTNPNDEILGVQVDNCVGGFLFKRNLALEFFGTDDPDELGQMFQTPEDYVYWSAHVYNESDGTVYMFSHGGDAFRAFSSLGDANAAPVVINDYQLNIRELFMPTLEIIEGLAANNAIGTMSGWSPAWFAAMGGDEVIFWPGPTWFISHIIRPNDEDGAGNWGLIAPPGGAFSWGGTAYSIPIGAQNPYLAWRHIRWLTLSQEGAASFFSAHDTPTLYRPAYYTDLFDGNYDPFFRGQNVTAKLLDISMNPDTQSRPLSIFDGIMMGAAGPVWIEMIDNGMNAEDAMTLFEDEMIFLDARLHR